VELADPLKVLLITIGLITFIVGREPTIAEAQNSGKVCYIGLFLALA